MSPHLPPDQPSTTPSSPGRRSGCAAALLAVLGFILLLPGICSVPLVLGLREMITADDLAVIVPLLIVFAGLFAVGIWLILRAFRRPAG